jgi:hypothetical protein
VGAIAGCGALLLARRGGSNAVPAGAGAGVGASDGGPGAAVGGCRNTSAVVFEKEHGKLGRRSRAGTSQALSPFRCFCYRQGV